MAHPRARRHALVAGAPGRRRGARVTSSGSVSISSPRSAAAPLLARAVAVDLDAVALGILEVERLAHE